MVKVADGVDTEGTAGVTADEIAIARTRKHKLDITKEINRLLDIFKIAMKTKKRSKNAFPERVNWYKFTEVGDGWMIKYEIEGFAHGESMGTRPMKFYVSDAKKLEIEKFVEAFPKRGYQDSRDFNSKERPERKESAQHAEDMLLNLDDLWDTEGLKEASKNKAVKENKDPWTA